ncbi:MAG: hypothetical protein K9I94_06795 [Bacteroidales bacterium]|nr:hypothetical protein [Bacteroidales bacterium]
MHIRITIIGLIIILIAPFTKGQLYSGSQVFTPQIGVNISAGANQFYGDVQQESNPFSKINNETEAAFSLNAIWRLTPVIGARGQVFYGQLTSIRTDRNKYFIADIFAYNLVATFDLSTLVAGYNPDRFISFYALGGIGLSNWRTTLRAIDTDAQLAGNGLSGDWTTEITSPFGIGANVRINDNWYITMENALNYMVNADRDGGGDMLDAEPTGTNNDAYNYFSIGISYFFLNGNGGGSQYNRDHQYDADKFDCSNSF